MDPFPIFLATLKRNNIRFNFLWWENLVYAFKKKHNRVKEHSNTLMMKKLRVNKTNKNEIKDEKNLKVMYSFL